MPQYKQIPQPGDQRNVSQGDILNNFAYLITSATAGVLPVDHLTSTNNTVPNTDGFHKQVSMVNRTTPANMVNAVNGQSSDQIVYSFQGTDGNAHLGFLNAAGQSICLTGFQPSVAQTGHSILPSVPGGPRILVHWGRGTTNASGDATVNFTPNFATFFVGYLTRVQNGSGQNRAYIEWLTTPSNSSGAVKTLNDTGNGFATDFHWLAIGTT